MRTPFIWKNSNLQLPQPFDTIFFDVDGVLINTIDSFHATDIAVTEYVAGSIHKLDWGQDDGVKLITIEDINAFKRAGGYNNDWDMCYLLSSLSTARLREWKGTSLAERSIAEWADLSRAANLQGRGGAQWVDDVIPASARLDYGMIGDIYHEYYWGAAEMLKRFGYTPRYLPGVPGFVHREEMLFRPDLPDRLRQRGILKLGMITGRVGPEVDSALERLEMYSGSRWWDVVISADDAPKPNPRAMLLAIDAVDALGGLYIGDTADDYDVVLNYRAIKKADEPDFLAAMLVHGKEIAIYQERGVDVIVSSVEALVDLLAG